MRIPKHKSRPGVDPERLLLRPLMEGGRKGWPLWKGPRGKGPAESPKALVKPRGFVGLRQSGAGGNGETAKRGGESVSPPSDSSSIR
jgi:hypothetical protein